MASSSQSTPTVSANIGGTNHQVNLRDYLNMRVAPFLKKAITESLDASPEFPLQWLGENLIHQSMLYEGNPDKTNIKERFLYSFDTPVAAPVPMTETAREPVETQPIPTTSETLVETVSAPVLNASEGASAVPEPSPIPDAQMSNHVNGDVEADQGQQEGESRDTEMEGTS